MSNSVGNQKALVANKHIFPTKAFWFPTEFNNVKFSREPKGVSSKGEMQPQPQPQPQHTHSWDAEAVSKMQQTMVLSVCGQGSLVAADAKLLCHLCQCGQCGSSSFKFEAVFKSRLHWRRWLVLSRQGSQGFGRLLNCLLQEDWWTLALRQRFAKSGFARTVEKRLGFHCPSCQFV